MWILYIGSQTSYCFLLRELWQLKTNSLYASYMIQDYQNYTIAEKKELVCHCQVDRHINAVG